MNSSKASKNGEQEAFDLSTIQIEERVDCVPMSIWVPIEVKRKYSDIQRLSDKRFGKFLKSIVCREIEKVKIPETA